MHLLCGWSVKTIFTYFRNVLVETTFTVKDNGNITNTIWLGGITAKQFEWKVFCELLLLLFCADNNYTCFICIQHTFTTFLPQWTLSRDRYIRVLESDNDSLLLGDGEVRRRLEGATLCVCRLGESLWQCVKRRGVGNEKVWIGREVRENSTRYVW